MKQKLQTSLGQHLVLTPQLRQAIHMLQLSSLELEAEVALAVESNPMLDWQEPEPIDVERGDESPASAENGAGDHLDGADWDQVPGESWQERLGPASPGDGEYQDPAERAADSDTLHDHLLWQLHLTHLPIRDRRIGAAIIDGIDDDGYLRESLTGIAEGLLPEIEADEDQLKVVLSQIQRFDPAGVAARDLGECLCLQLQAMSGIEDAMLRELANRIASGPMERLPKLGVDALARELDATPDQVQKSLRLLRTLDPKPGSQIGALPTDTYITPDCVVWRQQGIWRVALASGHMPRLTIHQGYEQMLQSGAAGNDAGYLRGQLQEARWLLKNIRARGETLLKVVNCLIREQSGFLEFGAQALRPLTLREVATEVGLHESTISRAISRKYVRTPRGTVPLRDFFASGIDTDGGGEASSTAIQAMIRRLIEAENPRKPLSDARLAETLKSSGVPVARRTVAKYREAMNIPSSHERVRLG